MSLQSQESVLDAGCWSCFISIREWMYGMMPHAGSRWPRSRVQARSRVELRVEARIRIRLIALCFVEI